MELLTIVKVNEGISGETWKFIVGVAGGLIVFLVGVIRFLFRMKQNDDKRYQKEERTAIVDRINDMATQQKESTDQLSSVVNTVKETVNNLKIIVEVIKHQQEERDPRTERRLNDHSRLIKELDTRITKAETFCSINHKNIT